MRLLRLLATGLELFVCIVAIASAQAADYFPPPGDDWEQRAPAKLGFDAKRLDAAVRFAQEHEIDWLRDLDRQIAKDVAHEPYPQILGATKARGAPSGLIVRHGYIAAEWGDVDRVEMSFSLTKSYLSALAGLALDRKLIGSMHDPVWQSVRDGGFDNARNTQITWHMLLNQTSEWEGVLWDKPDTADRRAGYSRKLEAPGTFWEYNDVRVNRLALALLRLFERPLPEVLDSAIMRPIGASDSWAWHGYRNSYVRVRGRAMQSVSGGSHWGGGLWASARDHARFGLLFLRKGNWNGQQILSERWIAQATTPTDIALQYGYLWWLNTENQIIRSAPRSAFFALGAGGNMIWIDPEHDMVVVTRWLALDALDRFAAAVLRALNE